jgi:hypothetical protein
MALTAARLHIARRNSNAAERRAFAARVTLYSLSTSTLVAVEAYLWAASDASTWSQRIVPATFRALTSTYYFINTSAFSFGISRAGRKHCK